MYNNNESWRREIKSVIKFCYCPPDACACAAYNYVVQAARPSLFLSWKFRATSDISFDSLILHVFPLNFFFYLHRYEISLTIREQQQANFMFRGLI